MDEVAPYCRGSKEGRERVRKEAAAKSHSQEPQPQPQRRAQRRPQRPVARARGLLRARAGTLWAVRLHVPSSSAETQREIQSTELGDISVCVCCRIVGKSSDLICVGGAWEVRGRCAGRACGGARALRDGQQGLCIVSGAAAHMTERVSMPELSAQAVLLKVWRG